MKEQYFDQNTFYDLLNDPLAKLSLVIWELAGRELFNYLKIKKRHVQQEIQMSFKKSKGIFVVFHSLYLCSSSFQ